MANQNLLSVGLDAALAGSNEILAIYDSTTFEIETKGDSSPLTLADKKAHQAIVAILKSSELPILSEEGKSVPYEVRKNWPLFWMVDPLDGTKEFIKRNGEFTVNIALIENQKPVLGVVAVPVKGEVYYGTKGKAFKRVNGEVKELNRSGHVDMSKPGIRVVASRSHLNEETRTFIDSLNDPQLVTKGSSLKFLMLADDQADIYPRFAPTMEWDTAAAHAVVSQLGIKVFRKGSSHELIYNKENLINPGFIAYRR